jgi:glutamyl-tRNA synthetase
MVAWLSVRAAGGRFLLRYEDLDTASVRDEHYQTQADDLVAIGLDWDGDTVRQTDRIGLYEAAFEQLAVAEQLYPCFCSRREIREAARAPNSPLAGHGYPGTCRNLSTAQRADRATTREPAWRLRAEGQVAEFVDLIAGPQRVELDDFVVRRNDGTPAYHLVVVVDDAAQQVDLVVRADDLLESTARHLVLYRSLGLEPAIPDHAHVPLVLAPDGNRLAKRHGAVDLGDRAARGESPATVATFLARSLDLLTDDEIESGGPVAPADLVGRFSFAALPRRPLTLPADFLA